MTSKRRTLEQIPTVPITVEAIMRSSEFQIGVQDKRAGRAPLDTDDWNYQRGRQWASVAPPNMRVLVRGKVNRKAIAIYLLEPIL